MTEEWRPVVGYEGSYSVSSEGRVRSERRIVKRSTGDMYTGGRAISLAENGTGHKFFNVTTREGGRKKVYVHRAVAMAFLGSVPEGCEVRHKDGNPRNNNIKNIEYGSRSDNMFDRVKHGNHFNAEKTHCKRGHPFDEENTIWRTPENKTSLSKGIMHRRCRECVRKQAREYQRRKRVNNV